MALNLQGELFSGGGENHYGDAGDGHVWTNRPLQVVGLHGTSSGIGSVHAGEGTSWKLEHFTIPEITSGQAEYEADPDKDSYDNLLEYSLGLDPRSANTAEDLPRVTLEPINSDETDPPPSAEENHLTMTVNRPSYFSDVDFAVEVSDDMHTWQCGDDCTITLLDTPTTLKVMDKEPMSEVRRRFMRLRVFRTVP